MPWERLDAIALLSEADRQVLADRLARELRHRVEPYFWYTSGVELAPIIRLIQHGKARARAAEAI